VTAETEVLTGTRANIAVALMFIVRVLPTVLGVLSSPWPTPLCSST
jgi:hypothetical protein